VRIVTHLPYVDEHAIEVPVGRERAWEALNAYVARSLLEPGRDPFRLLVGTDPPAGFAIAAQMPRERLELAGRHRFSRYALVFELRDARPGVTRVAAQTYAAFPGPRGRVYRALVIGTRLHVVATRGMLRAIGRVATGE
jgi:hypothetical protein